MSIAETIAAQKRADAIQDEAWRFRFNWRTRAVLEKLFAGEKAVERKPLLRSIEPITGAVEWRLPKPLAETAPEAVPSRFAGVIADRDVSLYDFKEWRWARWQKAVSERLEAVETRFLTAEFNPPARIDDATAFARAEVAANLRPIGPGLDHSQLGDELDKAAGEFLELCEAERDFTELCTTETGRIYSADVAAEKWARLELQVKQAERLADACEAAGYPVRYADSITEAKESGRPYRPAIWIVPAAEPTRAVKMPNLRRVNFFPTQAAARRGPMLRALRYWMDCQPWARMMTLTSGSRWREDARLENLNEGTKAAHKHWSELLKHRWFRRHAAPAFLGIEYGEPKTDPAEVWNTWTVHIHGHLIYTRTRPFTRDQWRRFERWCRLRLTAIACGEVGRERRRICWRSSETHVADNGVIRKADEACKYPVKPADLETLLAKAGAPAIRTFAEQVKGLRLAQPLGELKTLIRSVTKGPVPRRFVSVSTPDGPVVRIVGNWNRSTRDRFTQQRRSVNRGRFLRLKSEKAIERRRRKHNRRVKRLATALIGRINRNRERMERARNRIETAPKRAAYWRAVLTHCGADMAEAVREAGRLWETAPEALTACDLQPPAEVVRYWAEIGRFTEWNGPDAAVPERERITKPQAVVRNRLLARIAPAAFGSCRVTQPGFAVVGWDGDFGALADAYPEHVGAVADAARAHVAGALRVAARVDALPPERAAAGATHTGSHYPHNSPRGGGKHCPDWLPGAYNWPEIADGCGRETAIHE